MDCSPPGSSLHGDSPGRNTEVGSHSLLQGIFPTQRLIPGLLHCRRILYCLGHQGCSKGDSGCRAGNWTRASRLAGKNPTTEPPLHHYVFKLLLYLFSFWPLWVFLAAGAPSSWGEQGLVSCCGVQASLVVKHALQGLWAQQLWCTGLVARQHVGSPWTRDWARVPHTGRWTLTAGPPGKVLAVLLCNQLIPVHPLSGWAHGGHSAYRAPLCHSQHPSCSGTPVSSFCQCELSHLWGGEALSQAGGHTMAGFIVTYLC